MIHDLDLECRCGHVHRVRVDYGGAAGAVSIETRTADCCQRRGVDADPAAPISIDPDADTGAVDVAGLAEPTDAEIVAAAAAVGGFDVIPCATCRDVAACTPDRLTACAAHQAWRRRHADAVPR